MKIILSKDDIEELVKKYYDMESVGWNEDGSMTIDTTLEKITNDKNDMKVLNDRLLKRSSIAMPIYNPFVYPISNAGKGYTTAGAGQPQPL
jgi:hypothetical protein